MLEDSNGEIKGVAIEYGGFLGFGEKGAIMTFDQLKLKDGNLVDRPHRGAAADASGLERVSRPRDDMQRAVPSGAARCAASAATHLLAITLNWQIFEQCALKRWAYCRTSGRDQRRITL